MSNKAKFYVACFEDESGSVYDVDFYSFMQKIEDQLGGNINYVRKKINESEIRVFSYSKPEIVSLKKMSIPFAKAKKSASYVAVETGKNLTRQAMNFYNINSLFYDKEEKICLFTTSHDGPSIRLVQDYLQRFIPERTGLKIKFHSIVNRISVSEIHESKQVKSITLSLALNSEIEHLYRESTDEGNGLLNSLIKFLSFSRDSLNGNTVSMTISMGKERKSTLTIEAICDLINRLGINSDYIKEITVNYMNNVSEKLEKGKLKSNMDLGVNFPFSVDELSPDYLTKNADEYISKNHHKITRQRDEYFTDLKSIDDFELTKELCVIEENPNEVNQNN